VRRWGFDLGRHFEQLAFATFVLFYYTKLSVKSLVLITRNILPSKHSTESSSSLNYKLILGVYFFSIGSTTAP